MSKNSTRKTLWKMGLGIQLALSLGFAVEAKAGYRTIYYLPYASYQINYTGNLYQSEQVIFLGTVRSVVCDESQQNSIQGEIQLQFTQYIESQYRARLGVRYQWQERLGYWRWDTGEELLGMHKRIAERYPLVEHITTFYFNCGGLAQKILSSGRFKSDAGDSALINDLGGGRYHFQAWQGAGDKPEANAWHNEGVGTMGSDGLIHCIHSSVIGYANPHIITESYFQIIDSVSIKQVKYRFYTEDTKPVSQDSGWREGPTWSFVR
jgi:hypothetical protein